MTVETIAVRYWAAARDAAGVAGEELVVRGPIALAEVRSRLVAAHPDSRLSAVLAICSVLLGDRPVGTVDPGSVLVEPGATVEFLPPFAGG